MRAESKLFLEAMRASTISSRADDRTLAWNRLMEASDKIGPAAVKLIGYKNTAAGYGIAAADIASLREADMSYSIRPTGDAEHPFALLVLPADIRRAREVIETVGLGSDTD